ncbi:glycosyltransferase family protein [Cystoisospora suis]|uniref:Glycosyltransferase family protein n=1 Tax=Cystoisospora suis TaxID=483139 RepID=A0A2C6JHG2_9APIC|nr:glycosyltransferase family protein [Cystoisospora suis]
MKQLTSSSLPFHRRLLFHPREKEEEDEAISRSLSSREEKQRLLISNSRRRDDEKEKEKEEEEAFLLHSSDSIEKQKQAEGRRRRRRKEEDTDEEEEERRKSEEQLLSERTRRRRGEEEEEEGRRVASLERRRTTREREEEKGLLDDENREEVESFLSTFQRRLPCKKTSMFSSCEAYDLTRKKKNDASFSSFSSFFYPSEKERRSFYVGDLQLLRRRKDSIKEKYVSLLCVGCLSFVFLFSLFSFFILQSVSSSFFSLSSSSMTSPTLEELVESLSKDNLQSDLLSSSLSSPSSFSLGGDGQGGEEKAQSSLSLDGSVKIRGRNLSFSPSFKEVWKTFLHSGDLDTGRTVSRFSQIASMSLLLLASHDLSFLSSSFFSSSLFSLEDQESASETEIGKNANEEERRGRGEKERSQVERGRESQLERDEKIERPSFIQEEDEMGKDRHLEDASYSREKEERYHNGRKKKKKEKTREKKRKKRDDEGKSSHSSSPLFCISLLPSSSSSSSSLHSFKPSDRLLSALYTPPDSSSSSSSFSLETFSRLLQEEEEKQLGELSVPWIRENADFLSFYNRRKRNKEEMKMKKKKDRGGHLHEEKEEDEEEGFPSVSLYLSSWREFIQKRKLFPNKREEEEEEKKKEDLLASKIFNEDELKRHVCTSYDRLYGIRFTSLLSSVSTPTLRHKGQRRRRSINSLASSSPEDEEEGKKEEEERLGIRNSCEDDDHISLYDGCSTLPIFYHSQSPSSSSSSSFSQPFARHRHLVHMTWNRGREGFTERELWSIDSFFSSHPHGALRLHVLLPFSPDGLPRGREEELLDQDDSSYQDSEEEEEEKTALEEEPEKEEGQRAVQEEEEEEERRRRVMIAGEGDPEEEEEERRRKKNRKRRRREEEEDERFLLWMKKERKENERIRSLHFSQLQMFWRRGYDLQYIQHLDFTSYASSSPLSRYFSSSSRTYSLTDHSLLFGWLTREKETAVLDVVSPLILYQEGGVFMSSHVLSLSSSTFSSSLDRFPSFFVCLNPSFEREVSREENTYFSRPCRIDYSFLYSMRERRHLFLYQVLEEIAKALDILTLNKISLQSKKVLGRSLYHRVLYGKGWISGGGIREGGIVNKDHSMTEKKKKNDDVKGMNKRNNIDQHKGRKEREKDEIQDEKKKKKVFSPSTPWYLLRFSTFPPYLVWSGKRRSSSFDPLSSSASSGLPAEGQTSLGEEDLLSAYRKSPSVVEEQEGKKEEEEKEGGGVRTLWLYGPFSFSPFQSKYLSGEVSFSSSSFSVKYQDQEENPFSSSSFHLSGEIAKRTPWIERLQKAIQATSDRQEGKIHMFYSLDLKDISIMSEDNEKEEEEEGKFSSLLSSSLFNQPKERTLSMLEILQKTFCSCYCGEKMLKFFSAISTSRREEEEDDDPIGGKENKRRKKKLSFFGFLSERFFRLFKAFLSYL